MFSFKITIFFKRQLHDGWCGNTPAQSPVDALKPVILSFDVFFVGTQQPVETTAELTMTWNTMTFRLRHCNVINSCHIIMFVLLQESADIIFTSYIFLSDVEMLKLD